MGWPIECNADVHTLEQKKRWMMLKTMFDGNQASFNNFQHHTTWWPNEYNVFDSTMLDDVTLTCSVSSFGQALTARNVIVDESKKEKTKTLPFEVGRVSGLSITSSPIPGYLKGYVMMKMIITMTLKQSLRRLTLCLYCKTPVCVVACRRENSTYR